MLGVTIVHNNVSISSCFLPSSFIMSCNIVASIDTRTDAVGSADRETIRSSDRTSLLAHQQPHAASTPRVWRIETVYIGGQSASLHTSVKDVRASCTLILVSKQCIGHKEVSM